jgi:hypothetical protein
VRENGDIEASSSFTKSENRVYTKLEKEREREPSERLGES